MKYLYVLIYCLLLTGTFTSHADTTATLLKVNNMTIKINIKGQQFYVRVNDNPAAKAFVDALPLQLEMNELNGNEKFADLPYALPSSPESPKTTQIGDLMLYGKQTLVLFYKSFESSYRYTPIGKVIDPVNLTAVIDEKKVRVEFNNN